MSWTEKLKDLVFGEIEAPLTYGEREVMNRGHIEQLTTEPAPLKREEPLTVNVDHNNGWISVEDELPERGQRILVCDPTREPQVEVHVCNPYAEVVGHYGPVASVTHWMPIPEPPKQG